MFVQQLWSIPRQRTIHKLPDSPWIGLDSLQLIGVGIEFECALRNNQTPVSSKAVLLDTRDKTLADLRFGEPTDGAWTETDLSRHRDFYAAMCPEDALGTDFKLNRDNVQVKSAMGTVLRPL